MQNRPKRLPLENYPITMSPWTYYHLGWTCQEFQEELEERRKEKEESKKRQNMRRSIYSLLITAAVVGTAIAQSADIGSFDYGGKTYGNARATFVTSSLVKIQPGNLILPWDKLNPSVRFTLKPLRQKVIEQEKLNKIEEGHFKVIGQVISVVATRCIVSCREDMPRGDHLTWIGGVRDRAVRRDLPCATGFICVRGLRGPADGEFVNVIAKVTQEVWLPAVVNG